MSVVIKGGGSGVKYGVFYKDVNSEGFPTNVKIKTSIIPKNCFYKDNNNALFNYLENLEIEADVIGWQGFYNTFANIRSAGKFKLKVNEIGYRSFFGLGLSREMAVKVWIPNTCQTIGTQAFYDAYSGVQIYCEAESAQSGWASDWASVSITYGVSETEFDAL